MLDRDSTWQLHRHQTMSSFGRGFLTTKAPCEWHNDADFAAALQLRLRYVPDELRNKTAVHCVCNATPMTPERFLYSHVLGCVAVKEHNCRTRHDNLNKLLIGIGTDHGITAYHEPRFTPHTIATVNAKRKQRNEICPAGEALEREAKENEGPDVKWTGLSSHTLYTDTTFFDAMAASNIGDLTKARKQRDKEKHKKYDELIEMEDPQASLQVLEFTALGFTSKPTREFIERIVKYNAPTARDYDIDERDFIMSRIATQIALDNAKIIRRGRQIARGHFAAPEVPS